jgi:predicted transcriptional regulator of viral defense system
MPRVSQIVLAKSKIENFFDNMNKSVFTFKQMSNIFWTQYKNWKLGVTFSEAKFISFLLEKSRLKKITLNEKVLYIWDDWNAESIYEVALSLKPKSYISHYTAMFMHNLTEQVPKTIYITCERGNALPIRKSPLSQRSIDSAFQKDETVSNMIYEYQDYKIILINSSRDDQVGIVKYKLLSGLEIPITNIERTLIDILVKQGYSGGILEVIKAYEAASDKVQVSKLKAYLVKLQFTYPYAQAVGFCLEYIGLPDKRLDIIEKICEKEFNFYLARKIKEPVLSKRWCVYYPNYLNKI